MPAEIKKREKYTGPIRRLDKSAILSHKIKEVSVKTRDTVMRNERDDAREQNRSAASSAAGRMTDTIAESGVFSGHAAEQAVFRAYRRYGEKKLTRERQAVRLADAEVDRNTAETMSSMLMQTSEVIRDSMITQAPEVMRDSMIMQTSEVMRDSMITQASEVMRNEDRAKRKLAKNVGKRRIRAAESVKPAVSAEQVQQYRKRKAIREIVKKNEQGGVRRLLSVITGGSPVRRGAAAGSGRVMHRLSESTNALLKMLTAGGATALVIIVIMIFCGSGFTMAGDENGDNFAYDFYEIGSGDTAIVEVAEAQIGNVGGDKFWKWYGFNSYVHWCACFVSWCGDQCGYIKEDIIPKFAVVGNGASWFRERHRWASGGYSPKPGDVIFFDWDHDGILDHVGLVEACDGKTVTTIEGNSGNACKRLTYRRGAACIAGYGLVIVPDGGSSTPLIARNSIGECAEKYAYSTDTDKADYPEGSPKEVFKEALAKAYPNHAKWGAAPSRGASCDVFVGTCVRMSGIDKSFPRGLDDQISYLKRSDKFEAVSVTTKTVKDGDIIVYAKSGGGAHICIAFDGKVKEAGYRHFYPKTTDYLKDRLSAKGKKWLKVYRAK